MTDQEPYDEHAYNDGGSDAAGDQTFGGTPAEAPSSAADALGASSAPSGWPTSSDAAAPVPPAQPGYAPPAQPGYAPHREPGYAQPPQPGYAAPQDSGYPQAPQQTGYGQPQQPASFQPGYGQPGYGQPASAPQPSYAGSQSFGGDVLVAGPVQPKRRIAPIVTSIVVVVAIVIGGGTFAAVKLLGHNTSTASAEAATWAPKDSLFYAGVNLNPAESVKKDLLAYARHFPDMPQVSDPNQVIDALVKSMGADAGDTYETQVKPWLGDHAAIDVFMDAANTPQPIAILQVKDAAKANASLTKLMAENQSADDVIDNSDGNLTAFSIQDGYAVLGDSQDAVDEAVASAKRASLSSNSTFTSDMATLKGDQIATAWVDLNGLMKAAAASDQASFPELAMLGLANVHLGRVVMDLQVKPTYAEVEGRLIGGSTANGLKQGKAGEALGELPSGTVLGFSLANPEDIVKQALVAVSGELGAGTQSEIDQYGEMLGISLPGDLENLLGSEAAFGIDAGPDSILGTSDPLMTIITHPDNAAKALDTAKALADDASASGEMSLKASRQGSLIVVTNDEDPGSGKLADDPAFKAAMDGMPAQTLAAGYVNIDSLLASEGGAAGEVPVQAVGYYVGIDSSVPVFAVRTTVK